MGRVTCLKAEKLAPHFLSRPVGFLSLPASNTVVYWLVICNWVIKWGQVHSAKLEHFQKPHFQFSGASGKATSQLRRCKRGRFNPWIGKIPWSRNSQPTPVFWPGKFHGQRSLVGYSPWGHNESDTQQQHSVSDTGLMLEIKSYLSCSSRSLQFRYVHCYFLKLIFSYTSKT